MGEAYNKLLQIAADALTIDQTVTTILESIPISIGSSSSNMKTSVLTVDSREEAQLYAYGIMASASFIVVGIVVSNILILAHANKKAFCGHLCQVWCFDCICKCKKASKDRKGKKANMCERGCLWVFSTVVTLFVICFMWGDIDWMWDFFEMKHVSHLPVIIRLSLLCVLFAMLVFLMLAYIFVICLPGACFVWSEIKYFLPKYEAMTVEEHMIWKEYNEWDYKDYKHLEVTCSHAQEEEKECDLKGKIKVQDHFGKADITFTIDELDDVTCCDGIWAWTVWKHDRLTDVDPSAGKGVIMEMDIRRAGNNTPAKSGPPSNVESSGGSSSPIDGLSSQEVGDSIRDTTVENAGN